MSSRYLVKLPLGLGLLLTAGLCHACKRSVDPAAPPNKSVAPPVESSSGSPAVPLSDSAIAGGSEKEELHAEEPPKVPAGKISLKVFERDEADPPGLVRLRVGNGLAEDIKVARIWIFLLDAQGKLLGQKAFWLSQDQGLVLKQQQKREWSTLVPVQGKPAKTQVTFSIVELASGRSIHPESVLVRDRE